MDVKLVAIHWMYVIFLLLIIGCFLLRKDTTLISIIMIFLLGLIATGSISKGVSTIFTSFIYAITELLPTILIISVIVSMSNLLIRTGINDVMISPFASLSRTTTLAYWVTRIVMMIISLFFWPSPAVVLMGAVLLPVALRVGLPAMGVANDSKGTFLFISYTCLITFIHNKLSMIKYVVREV